MELGAGLVPEVVVACSIQVYFFFFVLAPCSHSIFSIRILHLTGGSSEMIPKISE